MFAPKRRKDHIDFETSAGVENVDFQPEGASSGLHVSERGRRVRRIGRIDEYCDPRRRGQQVTQESEALCYHFGSQKINPGRIAARPSEAGDKAELDRVFGNAENDRYCPGCGFSRERGRRAPWRRNHTHLPVHQVSRLLREPVESPFRQAILDGNVLALDVAGFGKAPAECIQDVRRRSGRQRTK